MVIQKYLTTVNYTKGLLKRNKFICLHYTANDGDTAWGNCNYFHKTYRGASAHYFVDENSIWQCVEDRDIAWSVGLSKEKLKAGTARYYNDCRNENSINIEMCSRKDSEGHYYIKPETVANTVSLVKYLMNRYSIRLRKHRDPLAEQPESCAQNLGLEDQRSGKSLKNL